MFLEPVGSSGQFIYSDKFYINIYKEVYFRKLQINMIKDYVTHTFKDSFSFYMLTDAQTIVKLVSACP